MFRNGVTHLTAKDDLNAVTSFVRWMSYVPTLKGAPLPRLIQLKADTWDRNVDYQPSSGPYDPRALIQGIKQEDGSYLSGLFGRESFQETLGGWATSVVVGQARLGGIPLGVIAVET